MVDAAPRVFKTSEFSRWARKEDLAEQILCTAASEMQGGLIDARLGGYLVKRRVALPGKGRRGGARTIVATNFSGRWFYIFGFSKSERGNIDFREERALRKLAEVLVGMNVRALDAALASGALEEICDGDI